jgi:hypothetical protein
VNLELTLEVVTDNGPRRPRRQASQPRAAPSQQEHTDNIKTLLRCSLQESSAALKNSKMNKLSKDYLSEVVLQTTHKDESIK